MKFITTSILFFGLLCMLSCSSSKNRTTPEQIQTLNTLVEERQIEFVADWAIPMMTNSITQISNAGLLPIGSNANRINLIGNVNYLRIHNDSVSAYLPYFGERQFGNSYGKRNVGIELEGTSKNVKITKDEKSGAQTIKFDITDDTESYKFYLKLFPNKSSILNINSNQRRSIAYQCSAKAFQAEK